MLFLAWQRRIEGSGSGRQTGFGGRLQRERLALRIARELFALVAWDRARVLSANQATVIAIRLFDELPRHPVVTVSSVVKLLETTKPTAAKAIGVLEEVGVRSETTGRRRDRTFSYAKYLDRLRVGTELG